MVLALVGVLQILCLHISVLNSLQPTPESHPHHHHVQRGPMLVHHHAQRFICLQNACFDLLFLTMLLLLLMLLWEDIWLYTVSLVNKQ